MVENSSVVPKKRKSTPKEHRRLDHRTFQSNGDPKNGVVRYWICTTPHCAATAWSFKPEYAKVCGKNADRLYRGTRSHNETICLPDFVGTYQLQMRSYMKHMLETATQWYKLEHVYNDAAKKFPIAANSLTFKKIESTLRSWRRLKFPKCSKTIAEFVVQLQTRCYDCLLHYDDFIIEWASVIDEDGCGLIVFFNRQLIEENLKNITHMFIDATYKTRAKLEDCMQLLTVLVVHMAKAVCIFYSLMSRKTRKAYFAVLSYLKSICSFDFLKIIMADFEDPMRGGASDVFPQAQIAGCNVHHDRALYRILRPIQEELEKNPVLANKVKKIVVLAFLPPDKIIAEYEKIKNSLTPEEKAIVQFFLIYYDKQWIRIVTPKGYSVWGLTRRTNNYAEAFNAELLRILHIRPVACEYLYGMGEIFRKTQRNVCQRLNLQKTSNLPSYESMYKNHCFRQAWIQLEQKEIDEEQFLQACISLKGDLHSRLKLMLMQPTDQDPEEIWVAPIMLTELENDPDFDPIVKQNPLQARLEKQLPSAVRRAAGLEAEDDNALRNRPTGRKTFPVRHATPPSSDCESEPEDNVNINILYPEVSCSVQEDGMNENHNFEFEVSEEQQTGSLRFSLYLRINDQKILKLHNLSLQEFNAFKHQRTFALDYCTKYHNEDNITNLAVSYDLITWNGSTLNINNYQNKAQHSFIEKLIN